MMLEKTFLVIFLLAVIAVLLLTTRKLIADMKGAKTRFQSIFSAIPDMAFISALSDGRIVEVNDKFVTVTGFSADEAIGKSTLDLGLWHSPEDREKLVEALREKGYSENFEMVVRRKDGTFFTGLISAKLMELNGAAHLISVTRDITERKIAEEVIKRNEEKFTAIANYTANWETWFGNQGEIIWVNPAAEKITGYTPEEMIAMPEFLATLIHRDDLQKVSKKLQAVLAGNDDREEEFEFRCLRKDGTMFWLSVTWHAVHDRHGQAMGLRVSGRDISQKKATEERVRILSQAVEQSPATIVITDVRGNIEYVNKKFIELTGYSFAEAIGQNPRILKSGDHTVETYRELWRTLAQGREWRGEFHNKKKNGELYWESASISPIFNDQGKIKQLLAVKEDISERKALEYQLQMQARIDVLTGISNRRYFMETMESELARNQRYPKKNVFLMLDIDHFKQVNDLFGHGMGDVALRMVAETCQISLRGSDLLGRIGGEEFAIFLVETDAAEGRRIAERIRRKVQEIELKDDDGTPVLLHISIGMTAWQPGDVLEDLLARSDKALYQAKETGRNRVASLD